MVSVRYLLNKWMDFDQTCIDTLLGRNELIIFQNTVSMRYLLNQLMNFDQTHIDTLLGRGKGSVSFGNLDLIFKVTWAL